MRMAFNLRSGKRPATGRVTSALSLTRVARRPARRPVVVLLRTAAGAGRALFRQSPLSQSCVSHSSARLWTGLVGPALTHGATCKRNSEPRCKIADPQGDISMAGESASGERLRCTAALRDREPGLTPCFWKSSVPSLLPTWSRLASRPPSLTPFVGRPGCPRSPTLAQPGSPLSGPEGFWKSDFMISGLPRSPLGRPKRSKRYWWGPTYLSCGGRRPGTRGLFVRICCDPRLSCSGGRITKAPYSAPAHGHQTPSW